jgi:hypothetical protein
MGEALSKLGSFTEVAPKHHAIDSSLAGSFYLESMINLMDANHCSKEKSATLREFIHSFSNPRFYNPTLGQSYSDFMSNLDEASSEAIYHQSIEMMSFIGIKYAKLMPSVMTAISDCFYHYEGQTFVISRLLKSLGKVARAREKYLDDILDILIEHSDIEAPLQHLLSIGASLYEIGLESDNKKRVFVPLLKLIKHSSPDLRILAIRGIRTQLTGQWDKPVKVLKDVILYDEEFHVRQAAVTALGEAGEYRSFALRDTVFNLVDELSESVNNMRRTIIDAENNGKNAFHIRCRFTDSKEVLKLLYHYTSNFS